MLRRTAIIVTSLLCACGSDILISEKGTTDGSSTEGATSDSGAGAVDLTDGGGASDGGSASDGSAADGGSSDGGATDGGTPDGGTSESCPAGMVRIDDVTGLYAAGWFCVDEVVSAELDPLDATADCTGRSAEVCPVAAIQLGVEAGLDFGRSGEWIATTEDPGCCCPCGAGYQDSERAFRMWRESEPDGYCECWDPSHVTEYLCCAAGGR